MDLHDMCECARAIEEQAHRDFPMLDVRHATVSLLALLAGRSSNDGLRGRTPAERVADWKGRMYASGNWSSEEDELRAEDRGLGAVIVMHTWWRVLARMSKATRAAVAARNPRGLLKRLRIVAELRAAARLERRASQASTPTPSRASPVVDIGTRRPSRA